MTNKRKYSIRTHTNNTTHDEPNNLLTNTFTGTELVRKHVYCWHTCKLKTKYNDWVLVFA